MPVRVTNKQRELLQILSAKPLSVSYVQMKYAVGTMTRTAIDSSLRRMEDRGFVRRLGMFPTKWELTQLGRNQL